MATGHQAQEEPKAKTP